MFRVIHIIPSLNKGGAERITLDICKKLSEKSDCEVLLVLMREDLSYEFPQNIKIKVTSSRIKLSTWRKNQYDLNDLKQIINTFKPNIIHSHLFEAELLSRGCLHPKIAYITHVHDNIVQFSPFQTNFSLKRKISDFFEQRWILRKYKNSDNHFISISSDTTQFLKKNLPNKLSKNIFQLSNAIDYNRFYVDEEKYLDREKFCFIAVGSLVVKKNHRLLLEIASLLKAQNLNFELYILGEGPERYNLEEAIVVKGLSDHVKLTGNVNDVPSYLAKASLFLHPATYEPFGLVLLEAMAAGLPVVSLDGGGNRDIVINGKNGFLIHENEASIFVNKISELISNAELYNQMSTFAKSFAKHYDIYSYIDKLIDFYKLSLNKKNYSKD